MRVLACVRCLWRQQQKRTEAGAGADPRERVYGGEGGIAYLPKARWGVGVGVVGEPPKTRGGGEGGRALLTPQWRMEGEGVLTLWCCIKAARANDRRKTIRMLACVRCLWR